MVGFCARANLDTRRKDVERLEKCYGGGGGGGGGGGVERGN